ncbi:glycerol-3-phosphate transporter [Thermosinus carboxydivorans Nor1]|uniref:Glycerol-3-phosphate transporter n=1 Tax=Thermosinus carboxydivorans Nor1 TaxID=401526 RepID=A1HRV4_9FIRM|nr:glycerol-3-phosphate transporter [Thermosinus carboxydivorans]EAX47275.1 glycerol-3-phosphate transporter [Thermosinus carboxydivorans Nor1]
MSENSKATSTSTAAQAKKGGLFSFFEPAPHIPRLPDAEVAKLYPKYRLQVFMSIFIGYATYYLTRSNFPMAAPHLIRNLGFTTADIGNVRAALGLAYGLSKFVMATWSDRSNPRYFMAAGLFLSGVVNLFFPLTTSVTIMFILMFLNGWFQGMGWPPSGRTMTHWFSVSERGTKMAIWNCAHNIGGGIIAPICIWALFSFGWQGMFYVPAVIAIAISFFIIATLRDTPQSVGLPPIEEYKNDYPVAAKGIDAEKELSVKEILFKYVLNNKYVWTIAIANAFVYCVRYGVVDWAPTYLMHMKQLSVKNAGWGYFIYEYAGIPGTLLAGWLSDKYFRGRRSPVSFIYMIAVLAAVFVYWKNPAGNPLVDIIALATIGFLIYGPVMLIGVSALDMVPKKAAGTAAGFTGLFGYLFGTVGASSGIGYAVKAFGWDAGFYILIGSCLLAMLFLLFTWNYKPTCEADDAACKA